MYYTFIFIKFLWVILVNIISYNVYVALLGAT